MQPFKQLAIERGRGEALHVSHSSIASSTCLRRFMFYKLLNMSRWNSSFAADTGSAMHAGYQEYLRTADFERAVWEYAKRFPYQYHKSAFDQRSVEAGLRALRALTEAHDRDYDHYQLASIISSSTGESVPAIEVPFEIRLTRQGLPFTIYDRPVSYIGYIDSIFRDIYNPGVYLTQDLKTTTKNRKDYTASWFYEEQTLPYQFVLENILGSELQSFSSDIYVTYIDIVQPRVQRIPLHRTHEDVRDWARSLFLQLSVLEASANHNWWPRNGKQCDTWNVCQYFDVCGMPEEMAVLQYMGVDEKGELNFPPDRDFAPLFHLELELEAT